MITLEKSDVRRAEGEFAPMITAETRAALRGVRDCATHLYLEVQSRPDGFQISDEWLRQQLNWTVTKLRRAKEALAKAGLYLWENIQTATGHWMKVCRYVTNVVKTPSSQVEPSDPLPTVGQGAHIPPPTGSKERGSLRLPKLLTKHSRDTCKRERDGKPCSQCAAETAAAKQATEPTIPASHPAYQRPGTPSVPCSQDPELAAAACSYCKRGVTHPE